MSARNYDHRYRHHFPLQQCSRLTDAEAAVLAAMIQEGMKARRKGSQDLPHPFSDCGKVEARWNND